MANSIAFNPFVTTNAVGSFSTYSDGYVQGIAEDDPAIRYALAGGTLATTETMPMWGGVAIAENIPTSSDGALGGAIQRSTSIATITGFSVGNQFNNGIITGQSAVPTVGGGGGVNFFRLGSGARIPVAIDPSLVALDGGLITQQVSWDFNNSRLQPYDASTATVSVTSITSSFNATTGVYTFAVVAAAATVVGAVGDAINVSGVTGTGASLVNGNQVVTSFTDNQHFSFQITAAVSVIATGALSGTIILNQGISALNVKVLKINIGNSKIVVWDTVNLVANYNNTGSAAIILI